MISPDTGIDYDIEEHQLNKILQGLIVLPTDQFLIAYNDSKNYYGKLYLNNAQVLLSKSKGNHQEFNKVYGLLISTAHKHGYNHLRVEIDKLAYHVTHSSDRLDNLYLSYIRPKIEPQPIERRLLKNIIQKCGTFFKRLYNIFIHPSFIGYFGILMAILIAFITYYIVEHDKVVAFFNQHFPFLHLK